MRIQSNAANQLLFNSLAGNKSEHKQKFDNNLTEQITTNETNASIRRSDIIAPVYSGFALNSATKPFSSLTHEEKDAYFRRNAEIAHEESIKRFEEFKKRIEREFGIEGMVVESSEEINAEGVRFAMHYIETPDPTMPNKVLIELPNGDVLVGDTTESAESVTNKHWNTFSRDNLVGSMERSIEEYKDLFMQYILELTGSGEVVEYKHGDKPKY